MHHHPSEIVILCAGRGSRLKSEIPKALQQVRGKPLLQYTLEACADLGRLHIVFGDHRLPQSFGDQFQGVPINWIKQPVPDGTASAVEHALSHLDDHAHCLVMPGDVPLVHKKELSDLLDQSHNHQLTLLTVIVQNPFGYGRIIREDHRILGIVEELEATPTQRTINEVFSGILVAPSRILKQLLPKIEYSAVTQERYYTAVVGLAAKSQDLSVACILAKDPDCIRGINTRVQQAEIERMLKIRNNTHLMEQGLQLLDPDNTDIRAELSMGPDCIVDTGVILSGKVVLGSRVRIEAHCVIENCTIDDDVIIHPFCHLSSAQISANCTIGPMARLRAQSTLGEGVKIGNFIEVKASTIGSNTKASHLSYLGNSSIGSNCNIGAGTITCNYDGQKKNRTQIGAHTQVGSNVSLVAPVHIGDHCTVGAGSVITHDVPDNQLAISRVRQRGIDDWTQKKGRFFPAKNKNKT